MRRGGTSSYLDRSRSGKFPRRTHDPHRNGRFARSKSIAPALKQHRNLPLVPSANLMMVLTFRQPRIVVASCSPRASSPS